MINEGLMKAAIDKWGIDLQMSLAQEECAELIVEIAHFKRGRAGSKEKLIEEIADVTIMAHQMAMMFGESEVQNVISKKMERLALRLGAIPNDTNITAVNVIDDPLGIITGKPGRFYPVRAPYTNTLLHFDGGLGEENDPPE